MITITKNAVTRITQVGKKKLDQKKFFRISISGGGCQGFQYNFDFDDSIKKDDQIISQANIKVLIDKTSFDILNGSTVDFVTDLMGSYFKISNPQASSTCGCGTSFSLQSINDNRLLEYKFNSNKIGLHK